MTAAAPVPSQENKGSPFGLYSEVYDLLYQNKDYSAETDFVVALLQRFLAPDVPAGTRIVDLACGTGRHVFELAQRNFEVTGSDISAPMIEIARREAARLALNIPFHVESFQTCSRIPGKFDAALLLFASAGYMTTRLELTGMLENVRALVRPGGLIVLDIWNGLAVLRDYSPIREKNVRRGQIQVRRVSTTTIDEVHQVASVDFKFSITKDDGIASEFNEHHRVRFFFPQEFADTLEACGFQLLLRCPFLDPSRDISPSDWNMTFAARRI